MLNIINVWGKVRTLLQSYGVALFIVISIVAFAEGDIGFLLDLEYYRTLLVLSLLLSIVISSFVSLYSKHRDRISRYKVAIDSADPIKRIEEKLREKSSYLRKLNIALLLMIISALMIGMYIFVSAEDLARSDHNYESASRQVHSTYGDLSDLASSYERYIKNMSDQKNDSDNFQELLELVDNNLVDMKDSIQQHKDQRDDLMNSFKAIKATKESSFVFISAIINKVGSIVILLFFVQIIVNLYRYNAKLATFYESRADALGLVENLNGIKYEKLLTMVYPNSFGFDKNPNPPMKEIRKIISQTFDKTIGKKDNNQEGSEKKTIQKVKEE